MPNVITARRALDYKIATGLLGLLFFVLILLPPIGGPQNWLLSLIGAVVIGLVLARPLGDRVRFAEGRVEFGSLFGRVLGSWPLDGTSRVDLDPVVTQSRWGRAVHGSLVLEGSSGMALALTKGRYTREREWSEFLLDQESRGQVVLTDGAKAALRKNVAGGAG
jgi:hypothetical protein